MNLLNLPAWKQEELLFLGPDSRVAEREVRGDSVLNSAVGRCRRESMSPGQNLSPCRGSLSR